MAVSSSWTTTTKKPKSIYTPIYFDSGQEDFNPEVMLDTLRYITSFAFFNSTISPILDERMRVPNDDLPTMTY